MKTKVVINTKDTEGGFLKAYLVQPKTVTYRPSQKHRERVKKVIRKRKVKGFFSVLAKGVYLASLLYAVAVVASLINTGLSDGAGLARLIVGVLWMATPLTIRGHKIFN